MLQPVYILLVGRATKEFEGIELATDSVAIQVFRKYLKNTLVNVDLDRDVIMDCKLGTGSSDLRDVFKRERVPVANDTSFGVGHVPFSELENIVYNTKRQLLTDLKSRIPGIGEDMKVMGLRDGENITLTICSGMIGRHIDDLNSYISMTEEMKAYTEELAARYTERDVKVYINAGDNLKTGSVFLTVTGTSSEMGDDGSVGRGNRCNGLITPNRPMSMEATSGKNPINHIGKIYNLLSTQMAHDIVKEVPDVQDVYIRLLSQIGKPIDQPLVASAQIIPREGTSFGKVKAETEVIIDDWLSNVTKITEMVIKGELNTF